MRGSCKSPRPDRKLHTKVFNARIQLHGPRRANDARGKLYGRQELFARAKRRPAPMFEGERA
jgi:hypothetical protein